jgi:hypothetical protein
MLEDNLHVTKLIILLDIYCYFFTMKVTSVLFSFSLDNERAEVECGDAAAGGGLCPPLHQVLEQPLPAQSRRLQVSTTL